MEVSAGVGGPLTLYSVRESGDMGGCLESTRTVPKVEAIPAGCTPPAPLLSVGRASLLSPLLPAMGLPQEGL